MCYKVSIVVTEHLMVTVERLRELLDYEPVAGVIRWKSGRKGCGGTAAGKNKVGAPLGNKNRAAGRSVIYRSIVIDGIEMTAGHVAWLIANGEPRPWRIGFANGDATDLRLANLVPTYKTGYDRRTPEGSLAYNRHWAERPGNKRRTQSNFLRRAHGITIEQKEAMVQAQGGVCAVCQKPEGLRADGLDFVVDHCHITQVIRGIIHRFCNLALGYLRDRPEIADLAAAYLRKHKK